jgi:UDP-glucose:(heptosyl)LPS alpha-1,3-glucosyltransferase
VRELVGAGAQLDRSKPWRIVVVGKASAKPYLELAEDLGCADRFLFPGAVADVLPLYGAADAYVQPTWYDPCSLVVLEALAAGLPVVTTRFNGASELMQDGREGYVLESPAEVEHLADAMQRLLDADRRKPMRQAAREAVKDHSIQQNFRDMMTVFEKATARKEAEK